MNSDTLFLSQQVIPSDEAEILKDEALLFVTLGNLRKVKVPRKLINCELVTFNEYYTKCSEYIYEDFLSEYGRQADYLDEDDIIYIKGCVYKDTVQLINANKHKLFI